MMSKKLIFGIIVLAMLIGTVSALPITGAVTDITSGNVIFHGTADGAATIGWFEWGAKTGGPYMWTTPNQTVTGGAAYSDYQFGPPMLTGTTYYVKACDDTGCGAEVAFAVPGAKAINQTRFGADAVQLMRGGFNITKTAGYIVKPFGAPFPSAIAPAVSYGLIFFFIFSGMWLRGRDMLIPMMLAMVSGLGLIWGGTGLGVPPDFITYVGQPLLYIGLAGIVWSWFTR